MRPTDADPATDVAFAALSATWARLLVEVAYNPSVDATTRKQLLEENAAFKQFQECWTAPPNPLTGVGCQPDITQLNSLIGRANGFAQTSLKNYAPVRGIDIEDVYKAAASVDKAMPGGGAAPGGGVLGTGIKGATLVVAGVAVLAGTWVISSLASSYAKVAGSNKR